jgi:hypothetical protein
MSGGIDGINGNKRPWKSRVERDIIMHKDIKESSLQGGKVIGNKLSLFSFTIGIPLFIIGVYGFLNILFGFGIPINMANIILVILVIVIGFLLIIGGYFNMKENKKS